MLVQLTVKNFVLIDHITIDFKEGLSVFTGETGAGKSLLVDAIAILCGAKASSDFIAANQHEALVEGVFDLKKHSLGYEVALSYQLDVDDVLVVSREISADSKNVCRINGKIVPLSTLKELCLAEIDIHSQHDSQYLLNEKYHGRLLDNFIVDDTFLNAYQKQFKSYKSAVKEYQDAQSTIYNINDLEYYQFQLNEIQQVNPSAIEYQELIQTQNQLLAYEKISHATALAATYLNNDEAALDQLYKAIKALETIDEDKSLDVCLSQLKEAHALVEDSAYELNSYISNLSFDQDVFDDTINKIAQYEKLTRKYGPTIEDVLTFQQELHEKIDLIENRQEAIDKLEATVNKEYKLLVEIGNKLTQQRKEYASKLKEAILSHLRDLQLPFAQFDIAFSEVEAHKDGLDKIVFMLSVNPGTALMPLAKVASGGELSRLMLGLKAIFTPLQGVGVVIFDEIDTGVSGSIAHKIALKMHQIAKDVQVFAITHLAMVAAAGHTHYLVKKQQDVDFTNVTIDPLNQTDRIKQLAQLASASESEQSLKAAAELLENTQRELR